MNSPRSRKTRNKALSVTFLACTAAAVCSSLYRPLISHSQSAAPARSPSHVSPTASDSRLDQASIERGESKFQEAEKLRSEQLEDSNRKAVANYLDAAYSWRVAKPTQAAVAFRKAGEVLQLLGNSSSALSYYSEAIALSIKTKQKEEQARILNDLAYLQFLSGDAKQAQGEASQALAIGRSLHNRAIEAEALSNLGETFFALGDLKKAVQKQEESLTIWRELNNKRGQAISLIALGYCYTNLGEPEQATNSYSTALLLAEAEQDFTIQTLAHVGLGNIQRKFGEKQQALDSYGKAQRLAERIGDTTSQAIISAGIATIHFEMGNASEALPFNQKAISLFRMNDKTWGVAETTLDRGRIQHSLGKEDEALESLTQALTLLRSLSMRRLESVALRAMGQVHRALGETAKALDAFKAALRLTRKGQDQRLEAYTLNYIGELYEQLKQPEVALKYYRDALPLSVVSGDPMGRALSLYNIARVETERGNLTEARRDVEAAVEIVESLRAKVSSPDLRSTYFAKEHETYELYMHVLMLMNKQNHDATLVAEAFDVSERARARSHLELLRESRANIREGADPTLLAKERELSKALNAKAQRQMQLLANKDKRSADEIDKELNELTSQLSQTRDQIKSNNPRYAALTLPQPLKVEQIQQHVLDEDSVILEYALGNDQSYVWLVDPKSVNGYELTKRSEIEDSARRLYQLFLDCQMVYGESLEQQTARRQRAVEAMPHEIALLSKLVLGPLAGKLRAKRLLIVADGALQYIPFQVLRDPDSLQPLLLGHEIVYEPSASTLALLSSDSEERPARRKSVAVLADPVFEADDPRLSKVAQTMSTAGKNDDLQQALRDIGLSPDGVQIPRLFSSKDEAEAIMNAVPWGTGFKAVGFAANRQMVTSRDLADYRIIHFATHGLINNEHPDLSGIVLSLFDSEGRAQDGFLRLHDIYNLRLPADVVVLSACSTGLGKDVRGEGLIGLTRGFIYAGASSVVASLWKVDDEATSVLMRHFYDAMFRRGLSPAAALRTAQLEMSKEPRWQSPYYWAGFVIQGQYQQTQPMPGPLILTPRRIVVTCVVVLTLFIATILIVRRRRA